MENSKPIPGLLTELDSGTWWPRCYHPHPSMAGGLSHSCLASLGQTCPAFCFWEQDGGAELGTLGSTMSCPPQDGGSSPVPSTVVVWCGLGAQQSHTCLCPLTQQPYL